MTIKRVTEYDLFATGDTCIFSMAGEPKFMYDGLTPSKHYTGYIKNVDTQRHEYQIVLTNDNGKTVTITHYADPVRTPVGLPLYFLMEVLLDKETYLKRLRSRQKKTLKYYLRKYNEQVLRDQESFDKAVGNWDTLTER